MVGVHVGRRRPAFYLDAAHTAKVNQRIEVSVFQARFEAKVVMHPACLGDAQSLGRAFDEIGVNRIGSGQFHLRQAGVHAVRQVIDALKSLAPGDHQIAPCKQHLQPALLVFPAPPAAGFAVGALKIRRFDRAFCLDMRQQAVQAGALFCVAGLTPGNAPFAPVMLVVAAVVRQILQRGKAGFVRPQFKQVALGQGVVQPCRGVATQAGKQNQVRAARNHMDGVDLQQLHARDAVAQT